MWWHPLKFHPSRSTETSATLLDSRSSQHHPSFAQIWDCPAFSSVFLSMSLSCLTSFILCAILNAFWPWSRSRYSIKCANSFSLLSIFFMCFSWLGFSLPWASLFPLCPHFRLFQLSSRPPHQFPLLPSSPAGTGDRRARPKCNRKRNPSYFRRQRRRREAFLQKRDLTHRVSKGPKRVLGFGRRQKLSCRSHFFLSGHIYPITQEFAWTNCILKTNSNSLSLFVQNFTFLVNLTQDLDIRS